MAQPASLITTLAGMMLFTACATPPAETTASTAAKNIRVDYIHPEKFTDVGNSSFPSEAARASDLEQLRKHLLQRAPHLLPAQQKLSVSITDIDMAGNFESWRIRLGDTRIIRDVYPPRIDLHFKLTDDKGMIIREGERKLRNVAFLTTAQQYRNDPLRYEKALLDDWLEVEFSVRRN